jgi:hypothetical protein
MGRELFNLPRKNHPRNLLHDRRSLMTDWRWQRIETKALNGNRGRSGFGLRKSLYWSNVQ